MNNNTNAARNPFDLIDPVLVDEVEHEVEKQVQEITVPEHLKKFLEDLLDDQATEIWDWLDENPSAVHEMVDVIGSSHPNIK